MDAYIDEAVSELRRGGPHATWGVVLQQAATSTEIEDAERYVGAPFPADLKAFYGVSNGFALRAPIAGVSYEDSVELFSVSSLLERSEYVQKYGPRSDWTGPPRYAFLTFADYLDGNLYAFDMSRPHGDYPYTIIAADHDGQRMWSSEPAIADSFAEWLAKVLECARNGRYLTSFWISGYAD